MKLASTTGDFRPLPYEDYLERVRHVAKAGFRYIDISFYDVDKDHSPLMADDWKDYIQRLISLAEELDIQYVQAHLPGGNLLDEKQYEAYCKITIRVIEVCGMLGIENAVIHLGWKPGITKEQFFEMNRDALKPLLPAMEKHRVNVLVENSTRLFFGDMHYLFTGDDIKKFIDYVGHPYINACWDTGHANIEGNQYDHILALGQHLRAIHVHDNDGHYDHHRAPFSGTLNMDELIAALMDIDYKGYYTFEAESILTFGQSNRRMFDKNTRLFDPTLEMYDAAEEFLYKLGKASLQAYGLFEQ